MYLIFIVISLLCLLQSMVQQPNAPTTATITIENQSGKTLYLQPEDTLGYKKLPEGKSSLNIRMGHPTYYRFVSASSRFHSLYVRPGSHIKLIYDTNDSLHIGGDDASINQFLNKHSFVCRSPKGVRPYSVEWTNYNDSCLQALYDTLDTSGLSKEFIDIHKLYLQFIFLSAKLNAKTMRTFAKNPVQLPKGYYDFLKELYFSDIHILSIPRWFTVMHTAFEQMEQQGFIPLSTKNYLKHYIQRITDDRLRDAYLAEALDYLLNKQGFSDDYPHFLKLAESLMNDSTAQHTLPRLKAGYEKACQANRHIIRGQKLKDFTAFTPEGEEIHPADYAGEVLIIDFWYTGCIPCKAEMPHFDSLARKFADQPVKFLSVSVDVGQEMMAQWHKMMQQRASDSPVVHANLPGGFKSDFVKWLNMHSVPRVVLVDKNGCIIDAYARRPSDPKLELQINQIVNNTQGMN